MNESRGAAADISSRNGSRYKSLVRRTEQQDFFNIDIPRKIWLCSRLTIQMCCVIFDSDNYRNTIVGHSIYRPFSGERPPIPVFVHHIQGIRLDSRKVGLLQTSIRCSVYIWDHATHHRAYLRLGQEYSKVHGYTRNRNSDIPARGCA